MSSAKLLQYRRIAPRPCPNPPTATWENYPTPYPVLRHVLQGVPGKKVRSVNVHYWDGRHEKVKRVQYQTRGPMTGSEWVVAKILAEDFSKLVDYTTLYNHT